MTKFRAGLVVGAVAGYYLGAKAGRRRYEQMNRVLRRASQLLPASARVGKARAVVDLAKERTRTDATDGNGVHPPLTV